MISRVYTLTDKMLGRIDGLLRNLSGKPAATLSARRRPDADIAENPLTTQEKRHIAGLMRINYAGELCAQALYRGQAFTARTTTLQQQFMQASEEEADHLLWCQQRLDDIGGHVSRLNPVWYTGSLVFGITAGMIGDRWSLGFLAETERQVSEHLARHLQQLPASDEKSRVILQQMREEEQQHTQVAEQNGAAILPVPISYAMRFTAKIMTTIAYWV